MLVKARQWVRETFEDDSKPPLKTVREWVESGEVPGRVIGSQVFVDADQFALGPAPNVEQLNGVDLLG